jgi:hypothetical protein
MVEEWVKRMTEDVLGGAPVEVGKRYQHPQDGPIEIVSGQYWGRHGLSNHWRWVVVETGEEKNGYAEHWPLAQESPGEPT